MEPPEGEAEEWKAVAQVYEKSYDEVLSALKHQDDKLNRTLTAIAFLTAAGIALFANVAVKISPPVRFDESPRDVTSFFFLVFLGSVGFALMFALTAIGPNRALPGMRGRNRQGSRRLEEWPSLLFYARIIKDPGWDTRIKEKKPQWLYKCLAQNLHAEAKTIGHRVDYKVAGSRQSAAFVHIALLALALLGIFSTQQFGVNKRWWIAATLLSIVLALPLLDRLLMGLFGFPTSSSLRWQWLSYFLALVAAVSGSVLLFAAPSWEAHWWAIFYCLGAVLCIRLAYVHELVARVALPTTASAGIACVLLAWWL